ncbi:MAG: hypothetical protein AB8H79_02495 [Myxococcota bacterium]
MIELSLGPREWAAVLLALAIIADVAAWRSAWGSLRPGPPGR